MPEKIRKIKAGSHMDFAITLMSNYGSILYDALVKKSIKIIVRHPAPPSVRVNASRNPGSSIVLHSLDFHSPSARGQVSRE
jgi:hypothetical protein